MFERRSGDLHTEFVANGEVTRGEASGVMVLRKENRLIRSVNRSPVRNPPLEGATGRILELAWILPLEVSKKSDRFEPWFGL
jgi:hypothetical protein